MDKQKIEMVLADPAVSYWLKDALRAALRRDPVDAFYDAKLLAELLAPLPQRAALEAERHQAVRRVPQIHDVAGWLNAQVLR